MYNFFFDFGKHNKIMEIESAPVIVYPSDPYEPRALTVFRDKITFGEFIIWATAGITFEDATVFRPGYRGMQQESMTIMGRYTHSGRWYEHHIELRS